MVHRQRALAGLGRLIRFPPRRLGSLGALFHIVRVVAVGAGEDPRPGGMLEGGGAAGEVGGEEGDEEGEFAEEGRKDGEAGAGDGEVDFDGPGGVW